MKSRYVQIGLALCVSAVSLPAASAVQRTFVASNGLDANPCSLTLPCRTFAAAMAQTAPGGEVIVLDSGGYGVVTINTSVSIIASSGIYAGISAFSSDGVHINGTNIKVTLRGLSINGLPGYDGVRVTNAASVKIEGCEISGFTYFQRAGIHAAAGNVTVVDSIVRDNWAGIWFDGVSKGTVSRTTVVGNAWVGIWANPSVPLSTVSVTVTDSVSSNNRWGFMALGSGSYVAKMSVSRSTASHNSYSGFQSEGSAAQMVVAASSATGNGDFGFMNMVGGPLTFLSFGNNFISDNASGDTSGAISPIWPK